MASIPFLLAAIWGIESDYGAILANSTLIRPIVPALFTVAAQRRTRFEADEAELVAALRLVADGGWTKETLVGSWAGAMGHTQLIVSALRAYGDRRRRRQPDRSATPPSPTPWPRTAAYLKGLGYRSGEDWGYEVKVPEGFDLLLATRDSLRPVRFFAERGDRACRRRVAFADPEQPVFLYLPAGIDGPAFLMTANYLVLKGYNFSDSYALSVAHLTDRLKGGGAVRRRLAAHHAPCPI